VKVFARHYGENLARKAAKEAEIAEKKKQAEAERQKREADLRQKQEDELRRTIRMANPGISDKEIEDLLPEMRREQLKQRTKTAKRLAL
jgi:predicted  nucleic acid-binding Zn-ribbon protein